MRLGLILPLVAALGLAACETIPEDTAETAGSGTADSLVSSSGVIADDVIVEDGTDVAASDSDAGQPRPGSQEELVQSVGDRVYFELDSAVLDASARRTLGRQVEWLELFPEVSLVIEGHCDERGTREYNLALGERRASAVRQFLIAQGIDASRLRTVSYGKERPYALGHDEEAWALNRRSVSVVD